MTLRQMMSTQSEDHLAIPCAEILDIKVYRWRGLLFDPARYFLPVDTLKDYIIRMAHMKLNKFQLHLTDYQGWRIEIREYPELTGKVPNPLNVTKSY
jgi:hexosaminidase